MRYTSKTDNISVINDRIGLLASRKSYFYYIIAGRDYRIIGARNNPDFQEGFELLLERREERAIIDTVQRISIAPTPGFIRTIVRQILSVNPNLQEQTHILDL